MSLGIVVNLVTFLILMYFLMQFLKTREFIYKLPKMTKSKYIGLEIVSRRVLIVNIVLFLVSIIVSNLIIKALLGTVMVFTISYALSELNILKEYVTKKRK